MIKFFEKMVYRYLLMNYCGQKIGNKYNVNKGLINLINYKLSFLISGVFIALMVSLKLNTWLILIFIGVFVYSFRTYFDKKISTKINFKKLEFDFKKLLKKTIIINSILSFIFFCLHIFYLVFSLKITKWILS